MSFIVKQCPCEPDCIGNVWSKIGPTTCSFVDKGFCPRGYYCPTYTNILLQSPTVTDILLNNSCVYGANAVEVTREPSLLVVCPCTPGFFCPENSSLPTYCPAGMNCPANLAITETAFGDPIPSSGLGAWGTLSYNCPAGNWCGYNTINPLDCGFDGRLNTCPSNSQKKDSSPLVILIIIAVVVLYLFFEFLRFIRNRRKKLESLMERKELSATEDPHDPNSKYDSKKLISEGSQFSQSLRDVSSPQVIAEEGLSENSQFVAAPEDLSKKEFLIEFEDITFTLKTGVTIMQGVSGSFKPS